MYLYHMDIASKPAKCANSKAARCSTGRQILRNYDTPVACTCRVSKASHAQLVENIHTIDRRALLAAVSLAQLWPQTGAFAAAELGPASPIQPADPYFYAQYPYAGPDDILPYLHDHASSGDPQSVLEAIDDFSTFYPMYKIGPEKGALLEQQLAQHGPLHVAVELGTFLGYSAIRIARQMTESGRLVCIEANPDNARVAAQVLALAGVADKVTILRGLASEQLPLAAAELSTDLRRQGTITSLPETPRATAKTAVAATSEGPAYHPVDFLFLDHCKDCYLPDLKIAEQLHLVGPGTLVMADNVVYPGAPGFLEYLESSGRYRTQLLTAKYEYEQAWNPNWELDKQDALSASVAQGDWSAL